VSTSVRHPPAENAGPVREVLLWRAERIGDAVMTIPAVKVLREAAPQARLTYATTDYAAELVRFLGLGDRVWAFPFKPLLGDFWKYRALAEEVRSGRFDRIFLLAKQTKYEKRIGPGDECVRAEEADGVHLAARYARAVMRGLGLVEGGVPTPRIAVPDRPESVARLKAAGLDILGERYVVIHPGSNRVMRRTSRRRDVRPDKTWPPQGYRQLIAGLSGRPGELRPVLVGAKGERRFVTLEIERKIAPALRPVNLCGRTSVMDLLVLLKHAALLVCGDSGVMHLGTVVGTPMVALFGPTDERVTGPFGMGTKAAVIRAVPADEAPHRPDCMERIGVEQVLDQARRMLQGQPDVQGDRVAG